MWVLKEQITAITELVETVTLGKLFDKVYSTFRVSNGGFYPPKTAAEFSNSYPSTLRHYNRAKTPGEYVRPKSTKGARSMSKIGAGERTKGDPYMRSQTYFMKNETLKAMNRQLLD